MLLEAGPRDGYESHESDDGHEDMASEHTLRLQVARLKNELASTRRPSRRSGGVLDPGSEPEEERVSRATVRGPTVNGLEEKLQELLHENEELIDHLREAQRQNTELRARCSKLEAQLAEAGSRSRTQSEATSEERPKDIRLLKEQVAVLMKQHRDEKEEIRAAEAKAKAVLKSQVQDSQSQYAKAKEELLQMHRELVGWQEQVREKEHLLTRLQAQHEEFANMVEEERRAAEEANEQRRMEVQHLWEQLEEERGRAALDNLAHLDPGMRTNPWADTHNHTCEFDMLDALSVADHGNSHEHHHEAVKHDLKHVVGEKECKAVEKGMGVEQKVCKLRSSSLGKKEHHYDQIKHERDLKEVDSIKGVAMEKESKATDVPPGKVVHRSSTMASRSSSAGHKRGSIAAVGSKGKSHDRSEAEGECSRLRAQLAAARVAGDDLRHECERLQRLLGGQQTENEADNEVEGEPSCRTSVQPEPQAEPSPGNSPTEAEQVRRRGSGREQRRHRPSPGRHGSDEEQPWAIADPFSEAALERMSHLKLREELRKAKEAELEAHRRADRVPELLSRIIDLQCELASMKKKFSEASKASDDSKGWQWWK